MGLRRRGSTYPIFGDLEEKLSRKGKEERKRENRSRGGDRERNCAILAETKRSRDHFWRSVAGKAQICVKQGKNPES